MPDKNIKSYQVEIIETLSRTIKVIAGSRNEAIKKVIDMYHDEEVVLDADDYVSTDFKPYTLTKVHKRNEGR